MGVNVVTILNSRKHNTKGEIIARLNAEDSLKRAAVKLKPPASVKKNKDALKYWNDTIKRAAGIDLLDDLDTDMIGSYCLMAVKRDFLREHCDEAPFDIDMLKVLQAQDRLVLQYANKLGLTADSRARLAKRKSEETVKGNKFSKFSGTG